MKLEIGCKLIRPFRAIFDSYQPQCPLNAEYFFFMVTNISERIDVEPGIVPYPLPGAEGSHREDGIENGKF